MRLSKVNSLISEILEAVAKYIAKHPEELRAGKAEEQYRSALEKLDKAIESTAMKKN